MLDVYILISNGTGKYRILPHLCGFVIIQSITEGIGNGLSEVIAYDEYVFVRDLRFGASRMCC